MDNPTFFRRQSVSGAPSRKSQTLCHETHHEKFPSTPKSSSTSLSGTGHHDFYRKPICSIHVLRLRNSNPSLYDHGICRRTSLKPGKHFSPLPTVEVLNRRVLNPAEQYTTYKRGAINRHISLLVAVCTSDIAI